MKRSLGQHAIVMAAFATLTLGVGAVHAIPETGLVASYPFMGNANDESGNGNHGVVNGAVTTMDREGNPDCAYEFKSSGSGGPAVTDHIVIPTRLYSDQSAGTISLWFFVPQNITGNTGSGSIFLTDAATEPRTEGGDPGVADFIQLSLGDFTGVFGGEILGVGAGTGFNNNRRSAVNKSTTGTIAAGWHHLALTSDETGHTYYLDGVEYPPTMFFDGMTAGDNLWPLPAIRARISHAGSSDSVSKTYKIDDVNFYDRALTSTEVNDLFTAPAMCNTAIQLSCNGYSSPLDREIIVKGKGRVLPFKADLVDEVGAVITGTDLTAPPVIDINFNSESQEEGLLEPDLSAGPGTAGNEFEFVDGVWQFNLRVKECCTASGQYTITMTSGEATEYAIAPTCTGTFQIP